jgi:signal peptidase I
MRKRTVALLAVCIVGLACVLSIVGYAYWYCFFGGRLALRITSGSMVPALNVGDMVMVDPVSNTSDIHADFTTGDIICFHKPGDLNELIVHRAVSRLTNGLQTMGDNNDHADFWVVTDDLLVGKVVEVNSFQLVIARALSFNVSEAQAAPLVPDSAHDSSAE